MRSRKLKLFATGLIAITGITISCDPFENDAIPIDQQVVFNPGNNRHYILPNSSAIIDTRAFFQSLLTNVNLRITTNPVRGVLTRVDDFLLKYEPFPDFTDGKDRFIYSAVSSGGTVLKSDTAIITVSKRIGDFPCALIAVEDFVSIVPGTSVTISYLNNDRICNARESELSKSIKKNPKNGTVNLVGDQINYSPKSGFTGWDEFVYEVKFIEGANTKSSLGLVSVFIDTEPCKFDLGSDSFRFRVLPSASIDMYVVENDIVCFLDKRQLNVTISQPPKYGNAISLPNGIIRYSKLPPFDESIVDSLIYQICFRGTCKQSTVKLNRLTADRGNGLYISTTYDGPEDLSMLILVKPESSPGSGYYLNSGCTGGHIEYTTYYVDAHGTNGKFSIEYGLYDYDNPDSRKKFDFTVVLDFVGVSYNGQGVSTKYFSAYDSIDFWKGPNVYQTFEKLGTNFYNISEINIEPLKQTDLTIELDWDVGDGTRGDVRLEMMLRELKYCSGSQVLGWYSDSSFAKELLGDNEYNLFVVFVSGTAQNIKLKITLSSKNGTFNGLKKAVLFTGTYTPDLLGHPDNCGYYYYDCPSPVLRFIKQGNDIRLQ